MTGGYFNEFSLGLRAKRSRLGVGLSVRGFTAVGELKGGIGGKDCSALDDLFNGEARLVVFQGVLCFQLQHLCLAILGLRDGELLVASVRPGAVGQVRHPGGGDGDAVNLHRLFLDVAGGANQNVVANRLGLSTPDFQGAVGVSRVITLVIKSEGGCGSLGVAFDLLGEGELTVVCLYRVYGLNLYCGLTFFDGQHGVSRTHRHSALVGNRAGSRLGGRVILVYQTFGAHRVGLRGPGLTCLQADGKWIFLTAADAEGERRTLERVRLARLDGLLQRERTSFLFVNVRRCHQHDGVRVARNIKFQAFRVADIVLRTAQVKGQILEIGFCDSGFPRLGDGTGHTGFNTLDRDCFSVTCHRHVTGYCLARPIRA